MKRYRIDLNHLNGPLQEHPKGEFVHHSEVRRLQRALRWAGQWCPDIRREKVSPMPTKDVQRLIYDFTVDGDGGIEPETHMHEKEFWEG